MSTDVATTVAPAEAKPKEETQVIKVLVWDLDNTLWDGTLLEGDDVRLRPGVLEILKTLDSRGILHSIASKNEPGPAMARLEELGLLDYFLYPQINWNPKSSSVEKIAQSINIGLDVVAFVDDQVYEREEVSHALPAVKTYDVSELEGLVDRPEFMPRFITDESSIRRRMYLADIARQEVETEFEGPNEEFLTTLGMELNIGPAQEEDLKRAEELTMRTHQLNTTGYTYNYDELAELRRSDDHLLLVASLDDKYGTYGKIGLVLIEKGGEVWNICLLLMSCRVMSRGVGTVLINYLLGLAKAAGVRLQAEFRSTDRNRMMLVTYKFAGFKEIERNGDMIVFENSLETIQRFPDYMRVNLAEDPSLPAVDL